MMDTLDRKLLKMAQKLPVCERPFAEIAKELDLTEEEVVVRLRELEESKVIRRFGGVFDSAKMGYMSTLVAARVNPGKVENVAAFINRFPGVTHNYQRDHDVNLWFTLTASSENVFEDIISLIKKQTGVKAIHVLPAVRHIQREVTFSL